MAAVSVALGACTATNKSADGDENINTVTASLQDEWRLDSYRVDCESTQFDATSNYELTFNEPDNTFSLSTDCNMINGEFGITNDTIRFKNILVTEMACDNMIVEQNMLRLLNDSTAYAMCHGDTLKFTAPYIGSAIFIKQEDKRHTSDEKCFIGEYTDQNDGSTLQISENPNPGPSIQISLFRLTDIDNGIGKISDDTLTFTATDAAGNPIKGEITLDGDTAHLTFIESSWVYLPKGTTYSFVRGAKVDYQPANPIGGRTYTGYGKGGGLTTNVTIKFDKNGRCQCTSDFYQAFTQPITVDGTYSIRYDIVEVRCQPAGFDVPIEWNFKIMDDGQGLGFDYSDASEEGSIDTDWLHLKVI